LIFEKLALVNFKSKIIKPKLSDREIKLKIRKELNHVLSAKRLVAN
jgi:hypothetical protein